MKAQTLTKIIIIIIIDKDKKVLKLSVIRYENPESAVSWVYLLLLLLFLYFIVILKEIFYTNMNILNI